VETPSTLPSNYLFALLALDTNSPVSFPAFCGCANSKKNSPSTWSGTVADFNNWRVIERGDLAPMVDTISQIRGYQEVRTWFLRAVSKLNEYIVIPETRVMHVRFRVASQNESLNRITRNNVSLRLLASLQISMLESHGDLSLIQHVISLPRISLMIPRSHRCPFGSK
jgi:hypothetical protein